MLSLPNVISIIYAHRLFVAGTPLFARGFDETLNLEASEKGLMISNAGVKRPTVHLLHYVRAQDSSTSINDCIISQTAAFCVHRYYPDEPSHAQNCLRRIDRKSTSYRDQTVGLAYLSAS